MPSSVDANEAPRGLLIRTDLQPLKSHPVMSSSEEDCAPPPPDFTRRGIHIPLRTSPSSKVPISRRPLPASGNSPQPMPPPSSPGTPRSYSRAGSSAESVRSYETTASSTTTGVLVPLQNKGFSDDVDRLSPLLEDDPRNFDLVAPNENVSGKSGFDLESRSVDLFSQEHLEAIFKDTPTLLRFTTFLNQFRPKSIATLIYYLDALKALRAINYSNAVAEALEPLDGLEFTANPARPTVNAILEDKAKQAFDILVRDDLPAFIAHQFVKVVSVSIQKRVTGNLAPHLREASEGLAEVFCLSDPSRADNPIIFASEEFHRTTQYGVSHAIGRNCRFLQGPKTNRNTIARLAAAVKAGKETNEVFLNYRRDGSPFMNLLMMAPLFDSQGTLRYFIGAQVDVSGLVKENSGLDAFQSMLEKRGRAGQDAEPKDEFQDLCEMFNHAELGTVRKHGGGMHREHVDETDDASMNHRPRVLIKDLSSSENEQPAQVPKKADGRLSGVYKDYILIRPAPSLRILFTSPSLRVPGVLQSRFLDRIGGSVRVRDSLAHALADGSRGVTAKVRWLATASADPDDVEEGRPRWIHCTPLLGPSGAVGVWMVVLVDEENQNNAPRRFRNAPPVSHDVRRPGPRLPPGTYGWEDSDDERPSRNHDERSSRNHDERQSRSRQPARLNIAGPQSRRPSDYSGRNELRNEPSIRSFGLS